MTSYFWITLLQQAFVDPFDQARPFIYKTGVQLYQRRAGIEFVDGILLRMDTAYADDRERAVLFLMQVSDYFGGALGKWFAAEAAGFAG